MLRSPTSNEFALMQALIKTDRYPKEERENRVCAYRLHDRLADGTEVVWEWLPFQEEWYPYQIGV